MEYIINILESLGLPGELVNLIIAAVAYLAYVLGRRRK